MPELPEVETLVRGLARVLPGRTVAAADVRRADVVRGPVRAFVSAVEGATIEAVERRAKFILFRLAGRRVWTTHLRMSGRFLYDADGGEVDRPYLRAVFRLAGGGRLLYVDVRTLGEMQVLAADAWAARDAALGPEPLAPGFDAAALRTRFGKSRRAVKEALLDQYVIAGIGNIYASEALWRARVSPRRRARNVGPERAERLRDALVETLEEAIGSGGTTLGATALDWADPEGSAGDFYRRLAVYDREGEPCRRCGTPIRRIVQGQRSTYYCPRCQR